MRFKFLGACTFFLHVLSADTVPSLYTFSTTDYSAGLHLNRIQPSGKLESTATSNINISGALVRTLSISPDDKKLYVPYLNGTTNGIYVYDIDPETGGATLNLSQSFTTPSTNANVLTNSTINAAGTSLYVTCGNTDPTSGILQYTIQSNGSLTPKSPAKVSTGGLPNDIEITPNGLFAYVSNRTPGKISQYAINPTTGVLTALSPATVDAIPDVLNLAISPDGAYLYAGSHDNGLLKTFSIGSNGQLTAVGEIPTGATENRKGGLTISSDGKNLYYSGTFSGLILAYSRNIQTGALTQIQTINLTTSYNPYFLVLSSDDKTLYATVPQVSNVNGEILVYTRDTNTGFLTLIQTVIPSLSSTTPPFRPMCLTRLPVIPDDPTNQTELLIEEAKVYSPIKVQASLI